MLMKEARGIINGQFLSEVNQFNYMAYTPEFENYWAGITPTFEKNEANKALQFEQFQTMGAPKSEVGIISPKSAIANVNEGKSYLDGIENQFNAQGQQLDPTTGKPIASKPIASPKDSTLLAPPKDSTLQPKEEIIEESKAIYENEDGQKITLTQSQLNDPSTKAFLEQGGYAFIESDGVIPDKSQQSDEEKKNEAEKKALQDAGQAASKKVEDSTQDWLSYDVEKDPAFQRQAQNITSEFDKLRREMERTNYQRQRAYETLGMRFGTEQFGGGISGGIVGEEIRQSNERMADINRAEASTISAARQAFESGKYTNFANQINALKDIREQKTKQLETFNQTLANANKKLQEEQNQIVLKMRDKQIKSSILNVIGQGLTDPIEILTALDAVGIQSTPEEVSKYTNLIEKEDTLAGLDQDLRTYTYLKENEPNELKSLGVSNYKDYLRITGDAKRAVQTKVSTTQKGTDGQSTIDYATPTEPSSFTQLVDRTGKPIKLTATQIDSVVGFQNSISQLQEAKKLIAEVKPNTGPISGRVSEATRLANLADPNLVKLDALLSNIKANYMKAISGAAVSESEVRRLAKFLPSINDTEENLQIKLAQFEKSLKENKDIYFATLGAQTTPTSQKTPQVSTGQTSSGLKYRIIK